MADIPRAEITQLKRKRRDRDSTKNIPDLPYDARKRQALSYDSSDDEAEQLEQSRIVQAYMPSGQDPSTIKPTEEERELLAAKRSYTVANPGKKREQKLKYDPTYGQASILPYEAGEDDEEEDDGLAYLRLVRAERETLPRVLTGPKEEALEEEDEEEEDEYYGGMEGAWQFWEDEAYIAEPSVDDQPAVEDDMARRDPQIIYHGLLLEQFLALAEVLRPPAKTGEGTDLMYLTNMHRDDEEQFTVEEHVAPPGEIIDQSIVEVPASRLTDRAHMVKQTYMQVRSNFAGPTPDQIRKLDTTAVINVLKRIGQSLLKLRKNTPRLTSTWIWSLLARLPDVLDADQTNLMRELGKKAILLQTSFFHAEAAAALADAEREGNGDEIELDLDGEGEGDEDVAPVEETVEEQSAMPDENTMATIDMILMVVCEVFGQRDLLEFRPRWKKEEKAIIE